jgi:cytochrome P450
VSVPKGTQVQIQNWSRHRSTELWGADANDFNPDRDFQDRELWHDQGFAAYNPHTDRFSPFTHPPRDCIGKNFAQMEMRVILLHLMKTFSFRPAPQLQKWLAEKGSLASTEMGINLGTMGPRDVSRPETVAYFQGAAKPPFGLPLFAEPRL